jgi:phage FluMu protein Com
MFDQYGTTVQCAFCKKNVLIPIKASADNSFECPSCEEENAVYITVETAQKTVFANDLLPDNTKGTITEARLSSNAGETPQ